jgi:murein L,D-transpeptidase YcbB/YkuD
VPAAAQTSEIASQALAPALQSAASSDRDLSAFYGARNYRPLWLRGSSPGPHVKTLIDLVSTARLDGLDPDRFKPDRLAEALAAARTRDPEALARLEMLSSKTLVRYVRSLRKRRNKAMTYVEAGLAPDRPSAATILAGAAQGATPVEGGFLLNPLYTKLRLAAAQAPVRSSADEARLRLNLERARAIPHRQDRYVLVDAGAQQLWMYEGGRAIGSMRVIVGRTSEPTPMLAGNLRTAVLNPYWYVPPDLVRTRVMPGIRSEGMKYLRANGYEVMTDWTDNARVVDPETVNWDAVAAGRIELPMRQRPGPANSMGTMKFMFPNDFGIYLHDTPQKELFGQADRRQSAGCVRLQDAPRLARWLFGKAPKAPAGATEHEVALPAPVPVYITYLTAQPGKTGIAFRKDFYGRDSLAMTTGAAVRGSD